jgi:Ca2+-binding RTX toxin-like protein
MKHTGQILVVVSALCLSASAALAQSASTCSFDGSTVTVTVNGQAANLSRNTAGAIRLNGVLCGAATVTNTDTIAVNGGSLLDSITLTGDFSPGLTPEGDAASEIEMVFLLGEGKDSVRFNYTDLADTVTFTDAGIDVGNDGDEDLTTAGTDVVKIYTLDGDDLVDASAYAGGGKIVIRGGTGLDNLTGSDQNDTIYGQDGDDVVDGAGGLDTIYGGLGNDDLFGGAGADKFFAEPTPDGDDDFHGGAGRDTVFYQKRTIGVVVTLNGIADDGEVGAEVDFLDVDVESVTGSRADDTLVGDGQSNTLRGDNGNDEIFGGAGNDVLRGGNGDDIIVGDEGADDLLGEAGSDSLDGGIGNDDLFGGPQADTLTGGAGIDEFFGEEGNDTFFNEDGVAETVDCGAGTADDPEPSATDTFVSCELI